MFTCEIACDGLSINENMLSYPYLCGSHKETNRPALLTEKHYSQLIWLHFTESCRTFVWSVVVTCCHFENETETAALLQETDFIDLQL